MILTLPVLEGLDGKQRMSKSIGNYIGIDEDPKEMYGKTMSIPDELIYRYFELVTDVDQKTLDEIKAKLEDSKTNPRDLKMQLAYTLVRMYHGEEAAEDASAEFKKVFVKKDIPDEMPEMKFTQAQMRIDELLLTTKTANSKSEARRLITGGGVSVDGQKITDPFFTVDLKDGQILKVGKRKFVRIRLG